jgi:hypothetical protein
MKSLALKTQLLIGSLAMVVLVMIASGVVVSIVINKQNTTASYQDLAGSLNIVGEELEIIEKKLISDSTQMATINEMGASVEFAMEMKDNKLLTDPALTKMAASLGQIAMTANIWKCAIYNIHGELNAFAVKRAGGKFVIGMVSDRDKGSFKLNDLEMGKQVQFDTWKQVGEFKDPKIKLTFDQPMPDKETTSFEVIDHSLCLVSLVPIISNVFNKDKDTLEEKQVGMSLGVLKLGKSFLARASSLAKMKINLFTNDGLSLGDLESYAALETDKIKTSDPAWTIQKRDVLLNNLTLKEGEFFQGVLPLYGAGKYVGAVAALESTNIVKSNTWQMVQLLGLVYLGCILVILPCGFAFSNRLTKPLVRIIGTLEKTSEKVSSASAQVSSSSAELAEGASEQAASLEETSSSIEEMASITQNNADSASLADNLTNDANQVINKANDSMKLLTTSMGEISKASEETSKIIKTIDEIAFQTNLLALNAAVEAARAGEAGAGFAVVADEVRNLAMRAADAARNTSQLIEDTVKKVKDGTALVTETAGAFNEVSTSSQKIGELTSEISSASREQAEGIKQINKAVSEMDMVIQRTAASAEESASAAQEMSAEAAAMKKVVNDLTTMVGGNASSRTRKGLFRKGSGQTNPPVMDTKKPLASKGITAVKPNPIQKKQIGPGQGKANPVEAQEEGFRDF